MKWFANLTTGAKLSLSFGIIIAILIIMMWISYSTVNTLLTNNNNFLNNDLALLENLIQLRDNQSDSQNTFVLIFLTKDSNEIEKHKTHLQSIIESNKVIYRNILNSQENNINFINKFKEIPIMRANIAQIADEQFFPLLNQGRAEELQNIFINNINQKFAELGNITVDLVNEVKSKVSADLTRTQTQVHHANLMLISLGIAALFIVILFVLILNRLISTPLKEISNATKVIAGGNLSEVALSSIGRTDEIGVLAETFSIMRKNIHQLTVEIAEIINSLETAVNEISAATSQLVASSSETATAISQTSTTIEEVKQTSRTANEKAKTISESSKKSNEISVTGNKAANEMMEMTNQIQHQMQLIAESMLRLSEQGQAIGTIMATVEDMAQQSNLLSVNASIEAAKAGEQGKGFAIVAQEVKSLASQSKQATNQVRDILGDIQKATSAAVMATEQGSKSVELGVKKSEETGESINGLVKTVTESARDAMQIAATTHQQLVGMEQAASAMENIKTATFQNVEGSKQLEEAAKNIKHLGTKLKQLISQYKLK